MQDSISQIVCPHCGYNNVATRVICQHCAKPLYSEFWARRLWSALGWLIGGSVLVLFELAGWRLDHIPGLLAFIGIMSAMWGVDRLGYGLKRRDWRNLIPALMYLGLGGLLVVVDSLGLHVITYGPMTMGGAFLVILGLGLLVKKLYDILKSDIDD